MEYLSCCNATGLLFPPHISLAVPSLRLGRGLHLALCVDYELCVLDVSPGVVWTCHGVSRRKVRRWNLLRWAPVYVAQSHWHIAAFRNLRKNLQRSSQEEHPSRIKLWNRNPMRWGCRLISCNPSDGYLHSEIVWKLSNGHSNNYRLHQGHRKRGSYSVAIRS